MDMNFEGGRDTILPPQATQVGGGASSSLAKLCFPRQHRIGPMVSELPILNLDHELLGSRDWVLLICLLPTPPRTRSTAE